MMNSLKPCKICGVPKKIGRDHVWNSDGTMTQRRDRNHRMLFMDSDAIEGLFANIEKLIGMPIDKMIIESKKRATKDYISKLLRGSKGFLARLVGIERVVRKVMEQGRVMGYGDINVRIFNWKDSYVECEITNPYSIRLFSGDLKGATEAIRKVTGTVTYEEVEPGRFVIYNYVAPFAPELEERLLPHPMKRKPGDIKHELCKACDVPKDLAEFGWDIEKGIIRHQETGTRMAIFGPVGIQVIFDELENELGENIPDTIVKAQQMYTVSGVNMCWRGSSREELRRWLAVQGLGNLVSLERTSKGFSARIENPAVPAVIVGSAAGFYEAFTGKSVSADWKLSEDGDLDFEVVTVD